MQVIEAQRGQSWRLTITSIFKQKSATGVARHRPGERETIGSVATRALTEDSVEMEFLTDDPVAQAVTYQRVTFDARAPRLRYCWASELDLMVRLAGLRLRRRYQDWDRGPFTAESQDRISVYEVTAAPAG